MDPAYLNSLSDLDDVFSLQTFFCALPGLLNYRYGPEVHNILLQRLFRACTNGNPEHLRLLFPNGHPDVNPKVGWSLREAQGAVEGAEYLETARGQACGHIFRNGEASYQCRTCASDPTCVMCARCFDASDHEGHPVYIHASDGNSGCCDCGDEEAWTRPVHCGIHSHEEEGQSSGRTRETPENPQELIDTIRRTIAQSLDYMCDVWSCSPEQLRANKTAESVREDERQSQLSPEIYENTDPAARAGDAIEYALMLWNDEKHTVQDVRDTVARACRIAKKQGNEMAEEIDRVGRCIVKYSTNLEELLKAATILEQPKLSVTIRTSRDVFREQMCGTIVQWLLDISGCAVGLDGKILKTIICEELLRDWRVGSLAHHKLVGQDGIYDHDREEVSKDLQHALGPYSLDIVRRLEEAWNNAGAANEEDEEDEGEESDDQAALDENDDMEIDESSGSANHISGDSMNLDSPAPTGAIDDYSPRLAGAQTRTTDNEMSDEGDAASTLMAVPRTPSALVPKKAPRPPDYWRVLPPGSSLAVNTQEENLRERVRLDWLILYDLRMWKQLRIDLREVFITTLIGIPKFKRLLALRFASVFTVLAELHLIADREPDHSLIFLSLQILTVPSITAEVVERGNFLTNLMAIIYTFLSTRQVGYPHQVDLSGTLAIDQGVVFNRRAQTFYHDMRHMLSLDVVRERIRVEPRYLLQFLDIAKIHQGICPNVRAVGEHVEYEMEAWMSLSTVMTEVMRLCRSFAESFQVLEPGQEQYLENAIRTTAAVATIHSIGAERERFLNSEIKEEVIFQTVPRFEFEADGAQSLSLPHYTVALQPMSCYHPLHYVLAWLISEHRSASAETVWGLLSFGGQELLPYTTSKQSAQKISRPVSGGLNYLHVLFDYPIRVCAWMAQTRAGMWVRNGVSLRHQIQQYRSASRRELTHQRDIFLVQTAFVVCNPRDVLTQIIDRFDLLGWVTGNYQAIPDRDEAQTIDMAEELIHFLIVVLCDRLNLASGDREKMAEMTTKRELIHALCYKPLSYADLKKFLTERVKEADDQGILQAMTTYKGPEGMTDHGTFTLKDQYMKEIDPYLPFLTRNQREEAEMAWRKHAAAQMGKDIADVVYEPNIMAIESGLFKDIHFFTGTPLFAQTIFYFLQYATTVAFHSSEIQATKIEQLYQFILQLILVAIKLDDTHSPNLQESISADGSVVTRSSFCRTILHKRASKAVVSSDTIAGILQRSMTLEHLKSCAPRVKCIFLNLQTNIPQEFGAWMADRNLPLDLFGQAAPVSDPAVKALKRKQALERQAKVMEQFKQQQATFLENQDMEWGDNFDELDDDEMTVTGHEKVAHFPSGPCILCQEDTDENKLYGTFGFITQSHVFRTTPLDNLDWVGEVLESPENLDEAFEDRPSGVASKNRRFVKKTTSDGRIVQLDRQDLAQGFPIDMVSSAPVSIGCGHIMHHTCYEVYLAATARRHATQIARHHPENIERHEFLCPLCKALGNVFLPIIWKPQPQVYPGELQSSRTLEQSISQLARGADAAAYIGVIDNPLHVDTASTIQAYTDRAFMPTLAAQIRSIFVQVENSKTRAQAPAPGFSMPFDTHEERFSNLLGLTRVMTGSSSAPTASTEINLTLNEMTIEGLRKVYGRLSDSMATIPEWRERDQNDNSCWSTYSALVASLSASIKAVEIAQRGVGSNPTLTFLDTTSSQTKTHLRVLANTIMSFISINSLVQLHSDGPSEYTRRLAGLSLVLFGAKAEHQSSILDADAFAVLSELTFYHNHNDPLDLHGLTKVLLTLELVKVVLASHFTALDEKEYDKLSTIYQEVDVPQAFSTFVNHVLPNDYADKRVPLKFLYALARKYALTFLRSSVLLFHVRFGVDFPPTSGQGSEIDRLAQLLRIPKLEDVIIEVNDSPLFLNMMERWLSQRDAYDPRKTGNSRLTRKVNLSHPAIHELIGLPKNYDTLQDEVMRRKCPTTGRPLYDPAICLMCGEIFCSQSVCCTKAEINEGQKVGGCWQHRQKCGGKVGIFLHIRKCTILYLHESSGSFSLAPYLDKFGETDPSLRSNLQLFLNQKRYDAIFRTAWLQHQIPSIIARRLEGEISTGGWETL